MMFALKIGSLFYKVIKMKIKGVIEDLKIKKLIKKIIVKIYLGLSLVLFWTVWGQFTFR